MADIRIATDYLQDLFEKLDNRLIDPALADWVFAYEAWQVVREKLQAQAEEIQELRRRAEDAEGGEQYVTGLVKEAAEVLGLAPYHGIVHRARAVVEERDRLHGERDELKRLTDPYGAFEDVDALIAELNEPTPQEAALQTELERLKQQRDELITEACAALKSLALLAVPPEGPIAHMNTGQEIKLADIERAVQFVSRWKGQAPGPGEGG